jgi:adenylate cyclase class 2
MTGPTETEVKIELTQGHGGVLERLTGAGLSESVPRLFEANTLYDTNNKDLRQGGMLLRLRRVGESHVITWKGQREPGRHKSRPELETKVDSGENMHQIFGQLGFRPVFRYEKYRTEYSSKDGAGVVTVDETPIGNFLEIEGPPEWIDTTAERLGFSAGDYILESYGRLYLAACERQGVQPTNMVFASHSM